MARSWYIAWSQAYHIEPLLLGHFFQPRPCPLSFHCLIISGIPSIANLLFSNRDDIVRSHALPFTFLPMPVPCTLNPFSILFCSLTSGCFGLSGINDSTLCSLASLKSSACRRREYAGPCQFPVRGFLNGRKGFRYAFASVSEWAISASEGDVVTVVVDAPALGSEEEVFSAIVIVEVSSDDGIVRVEVAAPAICGGGNFVKSLSNCPGNARASLTLTSFAAAIAIMVDMGVVRDALVASGVSESSPQDCGLTFQASKSRGPSSASSTSCLAA